MKKNSKSRDVNKALYCAFDNVDGYENEEDGLHAELIIKKKNIDFVNDTRNYGLFFYGKEKRIRLDPIRYNKMLGLTKEQMKVINNRNSHYFYPNKKLYEEYNCNLFRDEIIHIKQMWEEDFNPIIQVALAKIKSKSYVPGDDDKLMCGISGYNSAVARTNWLTMLSKQGSDIKKFGLSTSLYAQFFHLMVSRIEAITLSVITKNGYEGDRFDRNVLYAFKGNKQGKIEELIGYSSYDKMYKIWNFIKHNSKSTFDKLYEKFPELIKNKCEYKQGELAIYFVEINDALINSLLIGVEEFFKNYCKLVFDENYDEALWNYDNYFLSRVNNEIENIDNPLGLDMFDDID